MTATIDSSQKGLLNRVSLMFGRDVNKRRFIVAAILPIVLYMGFFTLLPLLWGLALAFFEYSPRRAGGPFFGLGGENPFVGLQHFKNMLDFSPDASLPVRQFHLGLKTTILFAFLILPLNLAITIPLAIMIESVHKKLRGIFRTIFFLPVLAPSVGVAIMWGYVYHPQRGLLNAFISTLRGQLTAINWIGDDSLFFLGVPVALIAIIIAYLWQDIGYNMVIFIAALQGIPQSIQDAARIDGVNSWQMFWYITVPLLKPTILLTAVLTMISSFQVFDIIYVITDGGRVNEHTQVLVLNIYDYAFRYQQMGWAAAVSLVLFLFVLVISLVQTRLLQAEWEY